MVTEAEVHAACDVINARGDDPKFVLIRAELQNRGSWSTIKRYRGSWIVREAEVPPVPEALRENLLAIATAVWRTAYPLAAGAFSEERRAARAEADEAASALEHAEESLAEKDAKIARLEKADGELRARVAASESAREAEAERHGQLAGEVAALSSRTAELQAMLGARSETSPVLRVVGGEQVRDDRAR